jgi:hypothetical protein
MKRTKVSENKYFEAKLRERQLVFIFALKQNKKRGIETKRKEKYKSETYRK